MTDKHKDHDQLTQQTIQDNVEKYGSHIALLPADNYLPAFAYSIGLFKTYRHPEIICFGLPLPLLNSLLSHAHQLIDSGNTLVPDQLYSDFLEGYDVQFLPISKEFYPNYLGYASWFYKTSSDFPVLQLVWPDKEMNFPWEKDFNPDWKRLQPLLDRDIEFKFYENKNLAVYTTQQVIEGAPILYVYHNADGDWQFHHSPTPKQKDARIVGLESLVEKDITLNDLYFLQYGWRAWRDNIEAKWEYAENN